MSLPETSVDLRDPRYLLKAIISGSTPIAAGSTYTSNPTVLTTGYYWWWIRVTADDPNARFKLSFNLENFDEGIPDEVPISNTWPNILIVRKNLYAAGDTGIIPIEGSSSRGATLAMSIEHLSSSPVASGIFNTSFSYGGDYDDVADQILADFLGSL